MKALCVLQKNNIVEFEQQFKQSLDALLSKSHQTLSSYSQQNLTIGFIATNEKESLDTVLFKSDSKTILILGYPISLSINIKTLIKKALHANTKEALTLLSSNLDGAFTVFLIENDKPTVYIITDPMGIYPIYINKPSKELPFCLSTEIKALSKISDKCQLSTEGFVSWIRSGTTYGEQTLVDEVKRLQSGAIYTISINKHSLRYTQYWNQPISQTSQIQNYMLDDLYNSLTDEITSYSSLSNDSQLALSGGFDSRFIAAILHKNKLPVNAISVEHPDEAGNLDGYLASLVAKKLSTSFQQKKLDNSFFSYSNYTQYLKDSELAIPSLGIFIAAVLNTLSESRNAIWEGLGLGFAFKITGNNWGNFDDYIQHGVVGKFNCELDDILPFFKPETAESIKENWHQFIPKIKENFSNDLNGIIAFIENGRVRHRNGITSMKVIPNYATPLIPGLGRPFRNSLGNIPNNLRCSEKLHSLLLNKFFPQLTKIPVISANEVFMLNTPIGIEYAQTKFREKLLGHWRIKSLLNNQNNNKKKSDFMSNFDPIHDDIFNFTRSTGLKEDLFTNKSLIKSQHFNRLIGLLYAYNLTFNKT